jgi:hypothetical protein
MEDRVKTDFKNVGCRRWTGFIWIDIWVSEHGNEFSVPIKAGKFLNHMSNYQLFRGQGSSL